jgi:recombination protein RecA
MDDTKVIQNVNVISTGSMLVDDALGIGGLPRGRIVEVYGPEGGGKTTLGLHCIAEAQRAGGDALFVDAEHALDMEFAKRIGVMPSKLIINQPDSAEQALDILEMSVDSGKFAIAVVDSVSALVPQAELDGEMGDAHMGLQARLMGQAMRKINGICSKTNTLVIFINQIRMKIGIMFGNPETTSGGNALKFFSSIRLDIRRIGSIKYKEQVVGNKVKVKIVKNKMAPPFRIIETELIFGRGFNKEGELLEMARELDVVELTGSKYNYRDKQFAKSKIKACEVLCKHRELYDAIAADVAKESIAQKEAEEAEKAKKKKKKKKKKKDTDNGD